MEVRVLGPMEVVDGVRSIDVGTRMHRAVLSLLVMEINRVVSAHHIIECLWGDEPPATAAGALHVYISGLRKVLEPDRAPRAPSRVLVTEPAGYSLRLPAKFIDVTRFEGLVGEGQALLAAEQPAAAFEVLELCLSLWRGSAYQDLAFESFLQSEIARLTELRATAGEARADAKLAMGRHAEAVGELSAMVAEDPLRERRWELLALALYRSGRQGEALRAVSEARRTRRNELSLDLGPELRRLERDILAHSPALDWRPSAEQPLSRVRRVPVRGASDAMLGEGYSGSSPPPSRGSESGVLPADECPHGYSLTTMGEATSPFSISGNEPDLYPDTPFQVLYVTDMDIELMGSEVVATGTNSFTVTEGTVMYAPIYGVYDEVPPVVPGFPENPSDAVQYFFSAEHLGAYFTLDIDGRSMEIGGPYLIGPIPIRGREPYRHLALATFLGPLSVGSHVVTIRGGLSGRGARETPGAALQENVVYTIEVVALH